jgi:hypothetical protein
VSVNFATLTIDCQRRGGHHRRVTSNEVIGLRKPVYENSKGAAKVSRRSRVAFGGVPVRVYPGPFFAVFRTVFRTRHVATLLVRVAHRLELSMPVMEESEIYAVIGEVMVLSARIEGSLESCIVACLPPSDPVASEPVLRRLSFASQVAILYELTQGLFDRRDTRLGQFHRWLGRLKRIRERHNDLVHEVLKVAQSREKMVRWNWEIARMREECAIAPHWAQILLERMAFTRSPVVAGLQ